MAGRIPELSFASRGMHVDAEPDQLLTPQIVDAAVEEVLEPFDEPTREQFRSSWAMDETSEVARLLQTAIVSRSSRLKSFADVSRRPITINYNLTADEQIGVSKRYPEMELKFLPTKRHDHPLAAVDRMLSSVKLHSKMPSGMRYVDFGGSIVTHVEQGNTDITVVGGVHDVKDAGRHTMAGLRLHKLANDPECSDTTRMMARSVIANEGIYYVDGSLQTFGEKFTAGVMSHVYDVPLLDIPKMMNRTGMLLFEGVVHFSSRFFFEEYGDLPDVGARFEIKDGNFRMGFKDSPSHWYVHDWEAFSAYGADQIMHVGDACYSYKIYENKGDTICFRILRVHPLTRDPGVQYMKRPGVPMMAVDGYEHQNISAMVRGRLTSTTRLYPKDVWERMVRSAMLDATRGELDFSKHFKSYKTITAGHKYNGVSTVSQVVKMTDVPWLVVDSALYALTQVTILRRTTRTFATNELERRILAGSSLPYMLVRTFAKSCVRLLGLTVSPIISFLERLITSAERATDRLVEASIQAQMVRIDSKTLLEASGPKSLVEHEPFPLNEIVESNAAVDNFVERVLESMKNDEAGLPVSDRPRIMLDGEVVDGDSAVNNNTTQASSNTLVAEPGGRPDWVPFKENDPVIKEEYFCTRDFHTPAQRRDAVIETVRAVDAEHKEIEKWASEIYTRFCGGRVPMAEEVLRCHEANKNFDFWYVRKGMIGEKSLLGALVTNFDYSGVFCPTIQMVYDPDGTAVPTRLLPVGDMEYNSDIRGLYRRYKSVDVDYTGWVMVSDGMKVLNGPHISSGLKVAHNLSFEYETAIMEGGPGCGKSYTITENFRVGDMVITPLRKSAEDIRKKLVAKGVLTVKAAALAVRTMDSVLVRTGKTGGFSNHRGDSAHTVHVDECFNTNAGRVYATLALLHAQRVMMYGDRLQIEHVVRADVKLLYGQVNAPHVVKRYTVFRSAPEVLAVYNCHYGYKLRTANKNRGTVEMVFGEYPTLPAGDVKLLVMNQATKTILKKRYPNEHIEIATTHEAQGSEADTVILFNLEMRRMGEDNPVYLYNQARYVNVAVSRAKTKFIYVHMTEHKDLVKTWIGKGKDPMLIKECSNLENAGKSILYV